MSVPAVDVVVRWGDWVLAAKELAPPRSFAIGEDLDCDVAAPAAVIGENRAPVLIARWDGDVRLVVPKGARVLLDGQGKRMKAARAIERSRATASTMVPGAAEIELVAGRRATLFFGAITVDITCSEAAARAPRRPVVERRFGLSQAFSLALHVALGFFLAAIAPIHDDEDEGVTDDQKYYIQQMLNRAAEKEEEEYYAGELAGYARRARRNQLRNQSFLESLRQDEWLRSLSGEGWSGKTIAEAHADGEREEGAQSQEIFGGFYERPVVRKPPAPPPAIRMSGPAESGASIPTLPSNTPALRRGAMMISGRLPPEVVQRIIRQNFGRFRLCYETGLRRNPNLQGRVSVRFVIGNDGAVSNVSNGGSDMPDGGVVSCIVRAFTGLNFPQPEGGIVTVVYPLMFSPGG